MVQYACEPYSEKRDSFPVQEKPCGCFCYKYGICGLLQNAWVSCFFLDFYQRLRAYVFLIFKSAAKRSQTARRLSFNYSPIFVSISFIALRARLIKSSRGIPISSHSRIVSLFTDAAKAFSFIRFRIDLGFTLATFLSG